MTKSITLENSFELQLVPDNYEKTITVHLFDTNNDTRVTLTTFENGKWNSVSNVHADKFFELVKVYPKIKIALKRVFGELREENSKDFSTTLKCARRRFNIQVKKILR